MLYDDVKYSMILQLLGLLISSFVEKLPLVKWCV